GPCRRYCAPRFWHRVCYVTNPRPPRRDFLARPGDRVKVCMIATLGGHLAQLELLQPASQGHDAYLVSVSSDHALQAMPGMRRYLVRQILRNPALLLVNTIQSLRIILRERPQVVITTGAGDALPTVLLCA